MDEAPDVRTVNRTMVDRILGAPAEEPVEDGFALRVLAVRGRRSGEERRTPVALVRHGGADHLVSPDVARDWVRNLQAEPRCAILTSTGREDRRAVRLGDDAGVPVVSAYLAAMTVPWALRAFPVAPGDPPERVHEQMPTIAVFRLDTTG